MKLLKNDLYRNFGIGFLVGGIAVTLSNPALASSLIGAVL